MAEGGATAGLSRALCEGLMRASLDPTLAIDAVGTVLNVSDSVERVFGYARHELVGRNIRLLMPEPHRSQHDEYLARYRRTGETHILGRTREFEVVHKQGFVLPVELSVARADLEGEGTFFIGSFRDITERKRSERALEESERRFRAIFDRSFSYMGLLDTAGSVLEANQAALDGAGLTRAEVVGHPFWEARWWSHSKEIQRQLQDAIRRAAKGEFVRFETEHVGVDGEPQAVDFSLKPVRDGEGRVVMLIPEGRDISELKRAQRAETAMLRALATIGESAAMLAHEIKNPITAVNMALRAVAHQLGEDQQAVLEDLVQRMKRLENIMRRTLGFSRPLEVRREPVDAAELLAVTVRDLRAEIVKRGAEVEVACAEGAVSVHADRGLMGEVVTNLLRNALEAVGERGRVRLHAEAKPDGARLVVEDDGPGIPDSQMSTLFKPFSTTKDGGTGLGLPFCRKVVEEHHGTIRAERGSLGGARFVIELPGAR